MKPTSGKRGTLTFGGLVALAVLAVSCSTSTGSPEASPSTDRGSSASSTTAPPKPVTEADLEALLPSAAEVGPDYQVDTGKDDDDSGLDDDEFEAAMKKACPELYGLMSKFGDTLAIGDKSDTPDADRSYTTTDSRKVEVELDTDAESTPTKKQVGEIADAANKCDVFHVPDTETGGDVAVQLAMRADDTYGDYGMAMQMRLKLTGGQIPAPITIDAYYQMFETGQVGVTVSAIGGLDPATFVSVPPDIDIVKSLSQKLDGEVADLQRH